jgi:hypothetical protein
VIRNSPQGGLRIDCLFISEVGWHDPTDRGLHEIAGAYFFGFSTPDSVVSSVAFASSALSSQNITPPSLCLLTYSA